MAVMEISIIPIGTKTASVSRYVARAINVLRKEANIQYTLTAMGTIIEAESVEILLKTAHKMHDAVLGDDVSRVVTTIKIDDRKDKRITLKGKVKSIKKKLKGLIL